MLNKGYKITSLYILAEYMIHYYLQLEAKIVEGHYLCLVHPQST